MKGRNRKVSYRLERSLTCSRLFLQELLFFDQLVRVRNVAVNQILRHTRLILLRARRVACRCTSDLQ